MIFELFHIPVITTLPTILGVDIDTALVQGVGALYSYANVVWPIKDVFLGLIFGLLPYYAIKLGLKLFLGSRTPGYD